MFLESRRDNMDKHTIIYFKKIDAALMAQFLAQIIREGLSYNFTQDDHGFEITLTGGCLEKGGFIEKGGF